MLRGRGLTVLIEIKFGIEHTGPALDSLASSFDQLVRHHTGYPKPPSPYAGLTFYVSGDPTMPKLFVSLPQVPADHPEANDVVSGELTLKVGEAEPVVVGTELGQVEYDAGDLPPEDTLLSASFVFVDNAGNKSATALTAEYTVADTTPPPDAVEGLGFRVE